MYNERTHIQLKKLNFRLENVSQAENRYMWEIGATKIKRTNAHTIKKIRNFRLENVSQAEKKIKSNKTNERTYMQ